MKIVLISPEPDIGCQNIRGIASYLRENGHKVFILSLPVRNDNMRSIMFISRGKWSESDEEIKRIIDFLKKTKSDLIGLSLMSPFIDRGIRITQQIKENLEVPVIWGGIHPSSCPEESLKYADIVCLWEGEEPLLELANRMGAGQNFLGIQNLWFRNNGKIIRNTIRPLVTDIDKYPFPDYDLKTNYVLHNGKIKKLSKSLLMKYLMPYKRNYDLRKDIKTKSFHGFSYRVMTSRGCPYRCAYCVNSLIHKAYGGVPIRRRSVDSVINELESVVKKFEFIHHISITDDNFLIANKVWINDFFSQYKEKIGLPFSCCTNPTKLNKEYVTKLVDAGMAQINIGIQSGCDRTNIEVYNRPQSNSSVIETANFLRKFRNLIPIYDIIVDNPFENNDDLKRTFELLLKLHRPYVVMIYSLIFFPNTPLFFKALEEGKINENYDRFKKEDLLSYDLNNYYNLLFLASSIFPKPIMVMLSNENFVNKKILLFIAKNREKILDIGSKMISLTKLSLQD